MTATVGTSLIAGDARKNLTALIGASEEPGAARVCSIPGPAKQRLSKIAGAGW